MKTKVYKLPLLFCTIGVLTVATICCTSRIASQGNGRQSKPTSVSSVDVDSEWNQIKNSSQQITSQQINDAFISYLNAELECPVPSLWSNAFVGFLSGEDCVTDLYAGQYYHFLRDVPIHCPKNVDVKRVQNGLMISLGNESCKISNKTLREMGIPLDSITAFDTEKYMLVAPHADWSLPYELFCIDKNDNSVKWKSMVVGGGQRNCSGPNVHVVFVVPSKDKVCVFGASFDVFYIEQFDIHNGINTLRWALNSDNLD